MRRGSKADPRPSSPSTVVQVAHTTTHSSPRAQRGETPEAAQQGRQLREAAETADVELLQQLLEEGADVNLANWYGRSALMAAAQSGDAQVTRLLVEARAHVNCANKTGWTCLMYASCNGHADLVSYLLRSASCDTQLRDSVCPAQGYHTTCTRPAYSFLLHLTTLRAHACAQRGRTARQMAKDESIQALFAELGNGARLSSYDFRCT
jgi:ankyrin repeat protein